MSRKNNEIIQAAYENACDCLYYGYGKSAWNNCGLPKPTANMIWERAKYDLAYANEYPSEVKRLYNYYH